MVFASTKPVPKYMDKAVQSCNIFHIGSCLVALNHAGEELSLPVTRTSTRLVTSGNRKRLSMLSVASICPLQKKIKEL